MQHTQNIVQSLLVTLAVVVVGTTTGGCTKDYCENDTHCRTGERCDTATNQCYVADVDAGDAGDAGDGGDARTPCSGHDDCNSDEAPVCLSDSFCGPCDAEPTECAVKDDTRPFCVAGECHQCTDPELHCTTSAPICNAGTCEPCDTVAPDCDDQYPGAPFCVGGECKECEVSAQCGGTTPICDPVDNFCRACVSHDECDNGTPGSGVCDWEGNGCVPAADRIYVNGNTGANCDSTYAGGGPSDPFCQISDAILNVSPGQNTIFVILKTTPNTPYLHFSTNSSGAIRIVSRTQAVLASLNSYIAYANGASTALTIDGLVIRDAGTGNNGVVCTDAQLTLIGNTINNNGGYGIDATNCTLDIIGNEIHTNAGGGVNTSGGTVTLEANLIHTNAGGGVNTNGGTVTLEANEIHTNPGGGIYLTDSNFSVFNNLIYGNGNISLNWGGVRLSGISLSPANFSSNTVMLNPASGGSPAGVRCDDPFVIMNSIVYAPSLNALTNDCTAQYSYVSDSSGNPASSNNIDYLVYTTPDVDGSYMLNPLSPCIDAGDPTGAPTLDFAGETRDASPDIGAYEYIP